MSSLKKKRNARARVGYRPLAIAALVMGGTIQFIAPALAGSLGIVNQATATYNDGTIGSPTYQATSNKVTITVAEKAGITIVASAPSNKDPKAGDTLFVEFTITNDGGDPTQLFIPGTATLSNNSNFVIDGDLKVMSVNDAPQGTGGTGIPVPSSGQATGAFTFTGAGAGGSIPVNSTVVVRVPIKVLPGANTTDELRVSLGDTDTLPAAPSFAVNNQPYKAGSGKKDVYTVDNLDLNPAIAGEYLDVLPESEDREAMATSDLIKVSARFQAFATVLKANGVYSGGATSAFSDDELTYNLALRVDNPTDPDLPSGLAASDLYGTSITVPDAPGGKINGVLISDAVPENTVLTSNASDVVAPNTNWQKVYTVTALTTPALNATWTLTRPTVGTITRVGFIYNTDASPAGNGPILKGSAVVSGFSFKVNPLASFTGGQIANIAQVFGQSQPSAPVSGTATQIVYDESGDQSSNNSLGGTDPVASTPAAGGITDGKADPVVEGIDTGAGNDPTNTSNTNIGSDTPSTDKGGEVTVYTIAAAPFTGPDGSPEAIGPGNDNNKDFTNKSIVLDLGLDPAAALTDAQTTAIPFNNTVKNASVTKQLISLIPSLPLAASLGANELALPDGTTITIDPDGAGGSAAAVVFTYSGGVFTPTGGSVPTVDVEAGASQNYTVTVDLPALPANGQLKGYPVIINAFIDADKDSILDANEPSNQTIDSYYTGYLKLEKKARILDGNVEILPFTDDSVTLSAKATPGRTIQYQITYTNVSTGSNSPGAAIGVKGLTANDLIITEDGLKSATNPNNWFSSTLDPVSTLSGGATPGSLTATTNVSISAPLVTNGTVVNDIQVYSVNFGAVQPSQTGSMTFDRKIK